MKKGKNLTKEDFEQIKMLTTVGLSQSKIARIVNRSATTVRKITNAETLEEYREAARLERRNYYDANLKTSESEGVGTAEPEVTTSLSRPSIEEQLERIAIALERLVEAWESNPTKKGWLK